MASMKVLIPNTSGNSIVYNTKESTTAGHKMPSSMIPEGQPVILRRPGVPTALIPSDWLCRRVSHFKVTREVKLTGFGLYYPENGQKVTVEISIGLFNSEELMAHSVATLEPVSSGMGLIRYVHFNSPVILEKGRLYEAIAYYHQFVPLYLKSDPFQSVQTCVGESQTDGDINDENGNDEIICQFMQLLPKGSYYADCYPTEIPELVFL